MAECLISIGSNLGDRSLAIESALAQLRANPAVVMRQSSRRHVTQPIGGPVGQDEFVNAAVVLETSLPPLELLGLLQALESRAGRVRSTRWDARPLDLDLLLYDDLVINHERLVLPHPRMAFRRFVLVPATEIAPDMTHPILGRTTAQLLDHLEQGQNYVAITGVQGVGKACLAKAVAARVGAVPILEPRPGDRRGQVSASRSLPAELEFLVQRSELLRGATSTGKKPYVITDFWLGQGLAYGQDLPAEEIRQLESAWSKYGQQTATPKLIVLVENNFDRMPSDPLTNRLIAVQSNLREQLAQPGRPPTLTLDAAHRSWNQEEVAAAILAMVA